MIASFRRHLARAGAAWVLLGAVAHAEPRLAPAQVAALADGAARACAWRFAASWPAPDAEAGHVERWRAIGCPATPTMNLHVVAAGDGRLDVTVLLPGATRQPPAVQREAALAVLARAAAPSCRERRVSDTVVVDADTARSLERWTVVACGARRTFEVTVSAGDDGRPTITIAAHEPAGSLSR